MPVINFSGGGKGKTANKGSSAALMAYLLHEQEERMRSGRAQLFDPQSCLFDATTDNLPLEDAVRKIDNNRKGLKKDEAKFYYADLNFSEGELAAIFVGCETDAEKETAIRNYVRESFIPAYAANFVGYKDKSGNSIEFKAEDIVWAAAVHSRRLDRKGNVKDGPGWHAHLVFSHRNQGMTRSLSPTKNQRNENKGSCQGGFDRIEFRRIIEKTIEEKYSYARSKADCLSERVDVRRMSIEDWTSQINALMMHGLKMQMEAEERRKAKEKAEEEARAKAAKEKAAREAAEAKRKAEELARAEAEKVAAKKATKARKPRLSAQEKEEMKRRPIEKIHHAWNNYYGDVRTGLAIFIESEEGGKKTYRTFGRQAALTAQHTDVPIEEFEHSSRKMIKFISLSLDKLRGVVAEFVKHDIPYYLLSSWGVLMSDEEQKRVLSPEKKEKTKTPAQKQQTEKTQAAPSASLPTARKPKTAVEQAFDVWQREHQKDRPDYPRVVFVFRDGPNGKFYQTYKEDAFSAAWTKEGRQPNKIDKGALVGTEYFSTNVQNIRNVVSDLWRKGLYCSIFDTNGKLLDLPKPEPKMQQQATRSSAKPSNTTDDVKVWTHQSRYFMNAVIDGRRTPMREISEEDWKAHKRGMMSSDKLIDKYYSPEDIHPSKNKGRGRGM